MKRACWIIAGVAILCVAIAGFWWWSTPTWPELPPNQAGQPQTLVSIDRDFGHRTGDLLSPELFVRMAPGTKLETSSLTVEGDFELAAVPDVSSKKLKDGSTLYRIGLHVQSFKLQQEVVLNVTMAWTAGDKRAELVVPPKPLYTSRTYDGRPNLQEGSDPRVPFYWYASRFAVPLALSCLAFLAMCAAALRHAWRNRPRPQVDVTYNRAVELFTLIGAGQGTREQHEELDTIIRERLQIGPIPASHLDAQVVGASVAQCLALNAIAIYGDRELDSTQTTQLSALSNEVLGVLHARATAAKAA